MRGKEMTRKNLYFSFTLLFVIRMVGVGCIAGIMTMSTFYLSMFYISEYPVRKILVEKLLYCAAGMLFLLVFTASFGFPVVNILQF